MLAVASTDALSLAEPSLLKKGPSSIPSCLDLVASPTGCSWSPDNGILYLASANKIYQYDPTNNSTRDLHATEDGELIRHIVSKDKDAVVFSVNDKVHILECGEISRTFESHRGKITSLSLSNDYTLLSSSSSSAIHIHNLATGVQTTFRGLNLAGQPIRTAIFHPHSRTRLLIGTGKQLLVYDVTRPSGPVKTIAMADSSSGDIIAVACSPFSKTLIAAATSEGYVGLIDLEKEKSLFRTMNLKISLNTLDFSPEGASVYLGTEDGKLLIVDLRALDKPPKTVLVSSSGSPITTMSVQRKAKSADNLTKTPVASGAQNVKPSGNHPSARRAASSAQVATSKSTPGVVVTPAKARGVKIGFGASPAVRKASTLKEGSPTKKSSSTDLKKVLSPVRDPHGNSGGAGDISVQLGDLANLGRGKSMTTPDKLKAKVSTDTLRSRPTPSPRAGRVATSASGKAKVSPTTTTIENPRRTRTLPTTSMVPARTRKTSNPVMPESLSTNEHLAVPKKSPVRRARTVSSASRAGVESISGVSSRSSTATGVTSSRPSSSASRPGTSASTKSSSPIPPVPKIPGNIHARSCTASPELPDMQAQPITPVPAQKRKKGAFDVLGLGTPEVERWIHAGQGDAGVARNKGKGKSVGFKEDESDGDEEVHKHERSLSLQISPRRPTPGVPARGSGSTQSSWAASPYPANPTNTSGGPSAHELLKTIVQDVMYDFQRETKAEMTGLHLDLVRMGRTWKSELRVLMDEYVGDLRDLREENQRLRLENERLRKTAF